MKKILLVVVMITAFCDTFAQQQPGDSSRMLLYEAGKLSPTFINLLMPLTYNEVKLGYSYTKGKFIPAQESTGTGNMALSTEGKIRLGTVDLWGSFIYERIAEDSTRFAHQTRNNPSTSYYYGSPASVSYRRSLYQAKAAGQKIFFNGRMPLSAGLDYRIGNHFSVNDPRGAINDFQINGSLGLGYVFADKLTVSADAHYGYGQEVYNVAYKNRAYWESTAFPAYNNYMINGYGEATIRLSKRDYRNKLNRTGVGYGAIFKDDKIGLIAMNGRWMKEKQFYYDPSSNGFDSLARYTINTTDLDLVWSKTIQNNTLTVLLKVDERMGEDFHFIYKANNYKYKYAGYNAKLAYTVNKKAHTYNYTLEAGSTTEERLDGIYGNHVKYGQVILRPSFGINKTTRNKDIWGYGLSAEYSRAMDNAFKVSASNVSYFTQQVIYHDYYYYTADHAGGTINIHYSKHFDTFYAGIKLTAGYTEGLNFSNRILTDALHPGKNRISGSIALHFYF